MANALYDTGRNAFLNGSINWTTDDIRVALVDSADYTVSLAAHAFLSDVPAAARVAVMPASMPGKSATAGVADANDVTLTAVTGDQSEALVVYKYNAADTAAQLIAYIDTATGLPVLPNGGNITVAWDNGVNKIFKL